MKPEEIAREIARLEAENERLRAKAQAEMDQRALDNIDRQQAIRAALAA